MNFTGTAEYVTLKYVGPPAQTLIRDKITNVRVLVFTTEKPIKQQVVMWKIGDNNIPEEGVEYHVDFAFSSFAKRKGKGYVTKNGRHGKLFDTNVEFEFRGCQYAYDELPEIEEVKLFETVDEFKKRLKSEAEAIKQIKSEKNLNRLVNRKRLQNKQAKE